MPTVFKFDELSNEPLAFLTQSTEAQLEVRYWQRKPCIVRRVYKLGMSCQIREIETRKRIQVTILVRSQFSANLSLFYHSVRLDLTDLAVKLNISASYDRYTDKS